MSTAQQGFMVGILTVAAEVALPYVTDKKAAEELANAIGAVYGSWPMLRDFTIVAAPEGVAGPWPSCLATLGAGPVIESIAASRVFNDFCLSARKEHDRLNKRVAELEAEVKAANRGRKKPVRSGKQS